MARMLSVDGGGTKLSAILVDEHLSLLGRGMSGGVNTNQIPLEASRHHIHECLDQVFAQELPEFIDIVYIVFVGNLKDFQSALDAKTKVGRYVHFSEAEAGLLAGGLTNAGLLALSGTGSDVFYISPGENHVVGGWGPIVGDDGSGVWIGHMAIRAVVRELNGWGEQTLLTPLVKQAWQIERDWQIVETVHSIPTPYSKLASLTRTVGQAAHEGDTVALHILQEAGRLMAEQMVCLLRRLSFTPTSMAVTLCGGAWKTHPEMLAAFLRRLRRDYPDGTAQRPLFEHVCAGPASFLLSRGIPRDEVLALMSEKLSPYRVDPMDD